MRLTCSRLALAEQCQWAFGPHAPPEPARTSSPAADAGSDWHAMAARLLQELPSQQSHLDAAWRAAIEASMPGMTVAFVEAAMAMSTDGSVEMLGCDVGRSAYDVLPPSSVCGTADVVYRSADNRWHLRDWKTGRRHVPAEDNAQLLGLAVLAQGAFPGFARPILEIAHIDIEEQAICISAWEPSDWDLDGAADGLGGIMAARATAQPTPGPHCTELWCPYAGVCPATCTQIELVAPGLTTELTTPEQAAELLAMLPLAEAACEAVRSRLRAWSDEHGGIVMLDGRTWQAREVATESIKGPAGSFPADFPVSVAKADIEAACRARSGKQWKSSFERAMKEAREAGCITSRTSRRYEAK